MAFTGWQSEAIEFFEALEADNSKAFWTSNKATYERYVLEPMQELVKDLATHHGEGKIFRPYRDVRFSKDKTPYKTNIAAVVGGAYIHLDAHALGSGTGMYMMATDQIERYRQAVAEDEAGGRLVTVIDQLAKKNVSVSSHATLKTAPKGYPKDHPRIELLRYKDLTCWQEWEIGAWLGTSQAKKNVTNFLRSAQPLRDWLDTHVGASTLPPTGRW